jgi:hypothetical protein
MIKVVVRTLIKPRSGRDCDGRTSSTSLSMRSSSPGRTGLTSAGSSLLLEPNTFYVSSIGAGNERIIKCPRPHFIPRPTSRDERYRTLHSPSAQARATVARSAQREVIPGLFQKCEKRANLMVCLPPQRCDRHLRIVEPYSIETVSRELGSVACRYHIQS